MTRHLLIFAALILAPLWAVGSPLPSSITTSVGADDSENRTGMIAAEYVLKNFWSVNAFGQQTTVGETDETEGFKQKAAGLGLASNPFDDLVGTLQVTGYRVDDDVQSSKVRGTLKYQWEKLALGLGVGAEKIQFESLPQLIFENGRDNVVASSYEVFAEYALSFRLIIYASVFYQEYDKDPQNYTQGLRVLVIPESVQTTASGFLKSENRLGLSYAKGPWSLGFDVISQRYVDADQKVQTLQWAPGYQINKNWLTALTIARSSYLQTDNNETTQITGTSGSLSVSYLFD